ncbi:predicted protein [Nematostella vectensis]|uniref:Protein Wnt n=1 Tax=Nematostella vectensis TaxID=45351 RepID=A7RGH9_NEMVE|nr:protein Wnt-1 [Nematostella vectensis]EDO49431.1 predicted protein [Nematostella vectensis]|eukprot:XP_001641494.1 predicted protein [Nematostella vectensis]
MQRFSAAILLVFMVSVCISNHEVQGWWNLGFGFEDLKNDYNIQLSPPNQIRALTQKQIRISRRYPELIQYIAGGARTAIHECQHQFRNRKWNCSAHSPENVFGKILKRACRETAFTYAITAAGVSHAIARACGEGKLSACSCDQRYRGVSKQGWQWGGCSDNIHFADNFSKRFVDAQEKGRDFRAQINLHNNEAGRAAVRNNMIVECKCHGLSEACTVKTCWKRLPDFRLVGDDLKRKFDNASMVEYQQNNNNRNSNRNRNEDPALFIPSKPYLRRPTVYDLVYYEHSPNFCERNPSAGSLGTQGRECNTTSMGTDGCELMCCGRGFTTSSQERVENCNCRFFWCCEVKCQKCKTRRIISNCL